MPVFKLSLLAAITLTTFSLSAAHADESMLRYIHPSADEVCANGPADLNSMPSVKDAITMFGGMSGIEGSWRLSGLAGVIAKVKVTIGYTTKYFYVVTNQDAPKPLQFCASIETPGILRLRIPTAHDKQIALIFVKPGDVGQSIYVAAEKSSWKFHKFKRVTEFQN